MFTNIFLKQTGLREEERAGRFTANRQNDLLSAALGAPDHPGRLRAYPAGYVRVKDVYGKGSRRRSHASERIYEQNQKIQEQSLQLQQQSLRIAQMEAMMGRVLQHLPPEAREDLDVTPTMPSHIPTQVSSNHVPPQQPPALDEVTISFILLYFIFI